MEALALGTKAISALARRQVLSFNVVARIAVGVVVIHLTFVRMPWRFFCHAVTTTLIISLV
jgi:hypothetical protein